MNLRDRSPVTTRRSWVRWLWIVIGFVFSFGASPHWISLVRDDLHYRCSLFVDEGYGSSWVCGDGIEYLGVGVTVVLLQFGAFAAVAVLLMLPSSRESGAPRDWYAASAGLFSVVFAAVALATSTEPRHVPSDVFVAGALLGVGGLLFVVGGLVGHVAVSRSMAIVGIVLLVSSVIVNQGAVPAAVGGISIALGALLSDSKRR